MPSYAYRAVHHSGRVSRGEMVAVNENELAHFLGESGMELIDVRETKNKTLYLPLTGRNVPPRVLAAFCGRMHDLLQSGIGFPEALRDAAHATDNNILREALVHIAQALSNGHGIAASFALYPRFFPTLFIAILGAGENSGDMTVIFGFLSRYANLQATTQERLCRALRYPLFLFLVAGSAVIFMMTQVVPQVVQFLTGIDGHLPLSTRMLVFVSSLFTDYGVITFLALVACGAGLFLARAFFPSFALFLDAVLLRVPFISAVIVKTSLARFVHSFAILFRSGCDVPACLRQARNMVSNRSLRAGIENAEQRVQSGASLSMAMDGVMPLFAIGLLRTGERSGNLGKSLEDIATAYDREAQVATENFIGMLEPALTLLIGAILTWTVMAVLRPLYGSLSILGGRM